MFNKNQLLIIEEATSKLDVFYKIANYVKSVEPSVSVEDIVGKLLVREGQSSTGFENGIAIPHAVVENLSEPMVVISRNNPISWPSMDGNDTDLAICILVNDSSSGDHLKILSSLAGKLVNEDFRTTLKTASGEQLETVFADIETEVNTVKEVKAEADKPLFVAITACPTGIAHTFMAAEALTKVGEQLGYQVLVETHGQNGPESVLTKDQIERAEAVIIAADVKVDLSRFGSKKLLKTNVASGVHADDQLFEDAKNSEVDIHSGEVADEDEEFSFYKSLMSGVTHMLPFVVAGGILIALRFVFGTEGDIAAGVEPLIQNLALGTFFGSIGDILFGMMLPVLAAYIAFSIGGRQGLMPGFLAGMLASSDGSGFLGAILGGFLAGYVAHKLVKGSFKLPKSIQGSATILFIPVIAAIVIGLVMTILAVPVGALNTGLTNGLQALENFSPILLGAVIGAMMAADMGGPVNKAAYVTGTLLLAEGNQTFMAAVMAGGMTPPLIIALANQLNKSLFTDEEKEAAKTNWILGLAFITEGAIPFAAKNPLKVIPALIAGSAVSGALTMVFKITLPAPHGGLFVFPLVNSPLMYLLAIVIGTVVGAFTLIALLKKGE
ncbi:fructose-specific PTS transporter subunit EIIC [Mollicutes bacterium LVI A0078]|nr:fructose-specific PTS transporter subunit EIIC [Mollicutes bacterium LVI A0075]WOO90125.1 fructose-specific PTS transporter subunit EIIC [Mollicutes bacterium LVI A0078]